MDTRHPYPLPDHDDRTVGATELRVSGSGDTPSPAFRIGQDVVALVSAEVVGVSHAEVAVGQGLAVLTRQHRTKVHAVYVVDQAEGRALLELERERQYALRRTSEVEQTRLPGIVDAVTTSRAEKLADDLESAARSHQSAAKALRERAERHRADAAAFRAEHPEAFEQVDPDTGEVLRRHDP